MIQTIIFPFFRIKFEAVYYTQSGDDRTDLITASVATHYWEF